ncbi:DUF6794 domain-containing protein [Lewinella sp. LCG006]|uniref:DUF6794 domain-containing protein n=1 Tax=Lewinella sp. LCG006 TaxID=3231911 RepID=UPI00346011C2
MRTLLFSLLSLLSLAISAQGDPAATEEQYESSYEWRVRQERLFEVYIPKDLGEVFNQLNQLSETSGRENFRRLSEQEAATKPFFGLGRWMSHNWGFYGGSRLTAYLNQLNLYHPDDMTRFLLVMYHRHLNKKNLDPRPVVEGLLKLRREQEQQRILEGGEIIHQESRILDSIPGGN